LGALERKSVGVQHPLQDIERGDGNIAVMPKEELDCRVVEILKKERRWEILHESAGFFCFSQKFFYIITI
jgi:hypothetical protein